MSFYSDKVRRYWFPAIILLIIVLAMGWIVAGVIYPSNVQGVDQPPRSPVPPTATRTATSTATASPTMVSTSTATSASVTATPDTDCTYSMYYWATNSDAWLIENILLGNLSYTKAEAIEIMSLEEPTPTARLMGQFFAALLNTLKGADASEIEALLIEARDWLVLRPHGIDLTQAELAEVTAYTRQLEAYNNGQVGPGSCRDDLATPTPAPSETPTATATIASGPDQPFFTATPTRGGGGRPRPTNTQPPPQATNTSPPPQPTSTSPPRPTPTLVVPPTKAPTIPPPTQEP
jgi:hypothetical protein